MGEAVYFRKPRDQVERSRAVRWLRAVLLRHPQDSHSVPGQRLEQVSPQHHDPQRAGQERESADHRQPRRDGHQKRDRTLAPAWRPNPRAADQQASRHQAPRRSAGRETRRNADLDQLPRTRLPELERRPRSDLLARRPPDRCCTAHHAQNKASPWPKRTVSPEEGTA